MKPCPGVVISMLLLLPAAQLLAQQDPGAPQTAAASSGSAVRALSTTPDPSAPGDAADTPLPQAASPNAVTTPVLQTANGLDLPSPGMCPVITDVLQENCARYPGDGSCQSL